MNKDQVFEKLTAYYEEEMKDNKFYQQNKENQELMIKLMQTTELFVRSFDYDMPVGHTVKSKLAYFIRRVIRRSTRFITKPYADKMQRYNESVCELLGQMIQQNGDKWITMRQKIESLERKVGEEQENNSHLIELIEKAKEQSVENKLAEHQNMIENIKAVLNDTVNKTLEIGGQLTVLNQTGNCVDENRKWMSYSQAGEDKIVHFLMNYGEQQHKAFSYLDIGCNHYKNLNNTYSFYQEGFRGVLVEANPNFISELKQYRPEDIILNIGVGGEEGEEMRFYITNNVDLSSFDKSSIEAAQRESPWIEIVEEVNVPMLRLDQVIERYCKGVPTMVSLDTEGIELSILESMDFERYRPFIFIIETIAYSAHIQVEKKRMDIINFMEEKGYAEFAFTGVNSIFVDRKQLV